MRRELRRGNTRWSIRESENNKYYASSYRHGGVGGVRMLRSVIETNREILIESKIKMSIKETRITSPSDKDALVCEEVGVANKSVDAPVKGCGVKELYLVDVNREEGKHWLLSSAVGVHIMQCVLVMKEARWLVNR